MIGTTVGQYRILAELGHGGMGSVYKALDLNLDRTVALKFLNSNFENNPELLERFRSEAKVQATLNHANIATLYNYLVIENRAVMVMEFIEGETLLQRLERVGRMQPDEAVGLFRQGLCGVGAAHKRGIVHRDLKPANLMVNGDGVVKVMDFGIAKVAGAKGMTRTNMTMGTSWYMAPEQVQGKAVDRRTDIYSMGVTLYELLTAQMPFEGDSEYEIQKAHVQTIPVLPSIHNPQIPGFVVEATMKALEKNPDDRFQTAEEFFEALDAAKASRRTTFEHSGQSGQRRATVAEGQAHSPSAGWASQKPQVQQVPQHPQTPPPNGGQPQGYGQQPQGYMQQPGGYGQAQPGYGQPQSYIPQNYGSNTGKTGGGKGGLIAGMVLLVVLALGGVGYVMWKHSNDSADNGNGKNGSTGSTGTTASNGATGSSGTTGANSSTGSQAASGSTSGTGSTVFADNTGDTSGSGATGTTSGNGGLVHKVGPLIVTQPKDKTGSTGNVLVASNDKKRISADPVPTPINRVPKPVAIPGSELTGLWHGTYKDPATGQTTHVSLHLQENSSQLSGTMSFQNDVQESGSCNISNKSASNEAAHILTLLYTGCTGAKSPFFNVPTQFSNVNPAGSSLQGHPMYAQTGVQAMLSR